MAKVERALIVGAGIGGLAAYTSLAQAGIAADVIERTDDIDVYGVGIVQPANSLRVLKRLGVLEEILDTGWALDPSTTGSSTNNGPTCSRRASGSRSSSPTARSATTTW
jgi:2-polyprenyl-6-methoxyphenol hydroxylase-like FAD-dependent oxidoreductase